MNENVDNFDGAAVEIDNRLPLLPPPHALQQQRHLSVARELIDEPSRMAKFMIAGGVAGAVSRTATAPIDRLKLLLQVRREPTGIERDRRPFLFFFLFPLLFP